jgi:hypothetical protein
LVLDAAGRHSLVAVRSLGRTGLRVCGLDSVADAPAFASRFCTVAGLVPPRLPRTGLSFWTQEIRASVRRVAGAPALSSTFESSVRGLYFAGLAAAHSFGPLLRFVCGTDFTTRRIGGALATE